MEMFGMQEKTNIIKRNYVNDKITNEIAISSAQKSAYHIISNVQ